MTFQKIIFLKVQIKQLYLDSELAFSKSMVFTIIFQFPFVASHDMMSTFLTESLLISPEKND